MQDGGNCHIGNERIAILANFYGGMLHDTKVKKDKFLKFKMAARVTVAYVHTFLCHLTMNCAVGQISDTSNRTYYYQLQSAFV